VLSLTVRQQFLLTATLSVQAQAQLFSASGEYRALFHASATAERILLSDLVPEALRPGGFRDARLNATALLRWEYRPGSILYLVYTRAQVAAGLGSSEAPTTSVLPVNLAHGPTEDRVLMKATYLLGG
jgi:hypothetical protein